MSSRINGMSYVGEKCWVAVPFMQDFLDRVDGAESHIADMATEALAKACGEHGLHTVDQKLRWRGTVPDARLNGYQDAVVNLPDDLLVSIYTAYAVEAGSANVV